MSSDDPIPPADPSRDVARRIEDLPAEEGAEVLEQLSREFSADVTEYLDPKTAADVLEQMEPTAAATVIRDMEPPEASLVLQEMHPDDRVDVLEHVPQPLHDELLGEMGAQEAAETRALEQYEPDTAGGIMTPEVTALDEDLTIEQAVAELRRLREAVDQMFYVYVVDKRKHLVGVLSMRDLILGNPHKRLSQIMRTSILSVPVGMDQEEVADLFRVKKFLAMPVVDAQNKLLGIITLDDVVEVIEEETTEDIQKMFGAGAEERLSSPWHFSFRKRVGWLIVNLATAFLAGWVVSLFDKLIERLAILAVYMPIVAGMGGNASAQAMAVAVRGIAMGRVDRRLLRRVLVKESIVGLLTGVIIGGITAGVAFLFDFGQRGLSQNVALGIVVAAALVINHTLACLSGAGIPFIMKKLGYDPAQSATIFATTVTDIAGFFSLLGLAWLFIRHLM